MLTPEYWGASFWKTMYSIAYTYPEQPTEEEQQVVNNFYNSLRSLLPCLSCRNYYSQLLQELPVVTKTRTALLGWLEQISNRINAKLGKTPFDTKNLYKSMEAATVQLEDEPASESTSAPAPVPRATPAGLQPARGLRPLPRGQPAPKPRAALQPRAVPRAAPPAKKKGCGCGKKKAAAKK